MFKRRKCTDATYLFFHEIKLGRTGIQHGMEIGEVREFTPKDVSNMSLKKNNI